VFVPFCCEVLSNLRKYLRDENATLLAEREGYYGVIGPADISGGERGTLPSGAYRQITSILCAADYVWVFYRWPEKTSIQGQFDNSTFVMAARYNEDLEEEFIYRETDAELTASMAGAYGWSTPSGSIRTAFPFNDKRHYGVDGEGNITFHMVGASTGGTQDRASAVSHPMARCVGSCHRRPFPLASRYGHGKRSRYRSMVRCGAWRHSHHLSADPSCCTA
jgi:hypothetical protein